MTPNILQTEASILNDSLTGRATVEITKLAGKVGEKGIRLFFIGDEELERLPIRFQPSIEIELYATANINCFRITSNNKVYCPLYKNDKVYLIFKDNSTIELSFTVGRLVDGKSVSNFLILSDLQLLHMFQNSIDHILIFNHKGNRYFKYDFNKNGNEQYQNKNEGELLFQIAIEHVVEGKKALLTL